MTQKRKPRKQKAIRTRKVRKPRECSDAPGAWPVQDLKNRLSEALRRLQTHGHQYVTKHGEPIAVLMSVEQFQETRPRRSFLEATIEFRKKFGGIDLKIRRDKSAKANRRTKIDFGL